MQRTPKFTKNQNLENLLQIINNCTKPSERTIDKTALKLAFSPILIVGLPRSGTTLLTQILASSNSFSYATNFISRFYSNPYLGALIQKMLFDKNFKFKNEFNLAPLIKESQFQSDLGKTEGILQPNVFWYFWRISFGLPIHSTEAVLTENSINKYSIKNFTTGLAGIIEPNKKKPIFMKALIANYCIYHLYKKLENPLFIYIRRREEQVINSIINARKKIFNDINKYWSFKPPHFKILLKKTSPIDEIVRQVIFTKIDIETAIEKLPPKNKLIINYDDLVSNPNKLLEQIAELNKIDITNKIDIKQWIEFGRRKTNVRRSPYADEINKSLKETISIGYASKLC